MNNIQVLDCTLRDGGYCNEWKFGKENIIKIVEALVESEIDIIECGFLIDDIEYDVNYTRFTEVSQIIGLLKNYNKQSIMVAMINYGKFDIEKLPVCNDDTIDGIRVAFHKKDWEKALDTCLKIKEKGYKVFVQAMISLNYDDKSFLELIEKVNEIEPYAFYIVDSFGAMKQKDLTRLFYIVDHNLKKDVVIGFHSHNNMQLAYSNAQTFVEMESIHRLLIDSSVFGMGRGAGNLNTELFVEYLNERKGTQYKLKPLLNIIDDVLYTFFQLNRWGYSLPNYLSAKCNAHPNYATYLDDKKTLTFKDMSNIFDCIAEDKKAEYDRKYIEELYIQYMKKGYGNVSAQEELKNIISQRDIVVVAPGRSAEDEKKNIIDFVKRTNALVISINADYKYVKTDYIFISNLRRFREMKKHEKKYIVTSNIPAETAYISIPYQDLLGEIECVKDNAGMMLIKFLINNGVKKVYLAGFDGYSANAKEDYMGSFITYNDKNNVLEMMNDGMSKTLRKYKEKIEIEFLTTPKKIR